MNEAEISDGSQCGEDWEQDDAHITDGKMPPYDFAKRRVSKLLELMNSAYLDLEPHYQRGVVWTKASMSHLIESMFRGYYVPPVIFNLKVFKDEDGYKRIRRTCVDGKQRLTSIREFLRGNVPCKIDGKPFWFCDNMPKDLEAVCRGGRRKLILGETAKQEFMDMVILCAEYNDLSQRQEIELFQRVQLGKPLSQAEALRATQGSWQDLARLYEEDFPDVINLVKQNRASAFRAILQCFAQIYECHFPSSSDGQPRRRFALRATEVFVSDERSFTTETKSHLRVVFDLFHDLVEEDRSIFEEQGFTKTKTFSPLELIAVCCLLSLKGAERPKSMLKGDILHLRRFLRECHSDLRLNNSCWASAWRFIDGLEGIRGAVDGSTIQKSIRSPQHQSKPINTSSPIPQTTFTPLNALAASTPSQYGLQVQNSATPSILSSTVASGHRGSGDSLGVYTMDVSTQEGSVPTRNGFGQPDGASDQLRPWTRANSTNNTPTSGAFPQNYSFSFTQNSTPPLPSPTFYTTNGVSRLQLSENRKRAGIDFGPTNNKAQELEAKRARLGGGLSDEKKG